jgi:hypothetical protein
MQNASRFYTPVRKTIAAKIFFCVEEIASATFSKVAVVSR